MASVLMIEKLRLWILKIKTFRPITGTSERWKHWVVFFCTTGPCGRCLKMRGKFKQRRVELRTVSEADFLVSYVKIT